jgi:hypothetical protein
MGRISKKLAARFQGWIGRQAKQMPDASVRHSFHRSET